MGGLAAGRFSRAATGGEGHPSPTGSELTGPLQPEYCLGTDGLGCGRGRLGFEDGCGHLVCCRCCRIVYDDCAQLNFGSAWCCRTAPQLITLRCTIGHLTQEDRTVAAAPASGAFPACHVHICAHRRAACAGRVS
eukprot:5482512-Prymnesium_polylepis.1